MINGNRFLTNGKVAPRALNGESAIIYAADAERAVLGGFLAHPDFCMEEADGMLFKDDFFVPAHKDIFECIYALHQCKQAIDIMTVHRWLLDKGLADQVGSPGILAELGASLVSHLNIATHIKIVKDKSQLRELKIACSKIVNDLTDNGEKAEEVIERAEESILHISRNKTSKKEVPFGETVGAIVSQIKEHQKTGKIVTGLSTPFSKLDFLTTGWHPGNMVVVGARPGIGKSALMLTMAHHLLSQTTPVPCHVFSMEMERKQLAFRLMSIHSETKMQNLRTGKLKKEDVAAIQLAETQMKTWPIIIDDDPGLDIMQVRSRARRAKRKHNTAIIFIDYLQLMRSKKHSAKRHEEVSEISRGLKEMAKELQIPVIVLAQLRRTDDETPCVEHLRESGAIEQDSDIVIFPHKKEGKDDEGRLLYNLILAKQRDGPTGNVSIVYDGGFTRFLEG
jgi:replicative DNA helicase